MDPFPSAGIAIHIFFVEHWAFFKIGASDTICLSGTKPLPAPTMALSIGPLKTNFNWNFNQYAKLFIKENPSGILGPLSLTWINCNPSIDISNHMPSKLWDEITYPSPNSNGGNRWSLGTDKLLHPTLYNGYDYIFMLRLKLIHFSKRNPRSFENRHRLDSKVDKSHSVDTIINDLCWALSVI